jgi:hypothetical protein
VVRHPPRYSGRARLALRRISVLLKGRIARTLRPPPCLPELCSWYTDNRWGGLGGVLTSFALRWQIILKARLSSNTGVTRDVSLAGDIRYEALALYRKFWL